MSLLVFAGLSLAGMYGVAVWYQHSQASKPLELGVSFVPDYAQYLGVEPKETMDSLIGIGVKQFRLVSYWSDVEPSQGQYDFSQLDWQFQKAEAAGAGVSLSVGLRQPRWPECHPPSWIDTTKPSSQWQPQLETYMAAVISRYRSSPALQSYQLENEFYLNNFGTCTNSDQSRLDSEFSLLKRLDTKHPVILTRSDNIPHWPPDNPPSELRGISVYRRIWDANLTHRYFTYPLPSWYYSFLAGVQKLKTGQDSVLHELQTEAWAPNGQILTQISLDEQNKSFDASRFRDSVEFGKQTGLKHIDLWGSEYWYYRLKVLHDPSVWNVAKDEFHAS